MREVRGISFDAGQTLVYPEPAVEEVYAEAFARHGLSPSPDEIHRSVHATWKEVAARHARGEERWGATGGDAAFWRRFVGSVFSGVGGGALPEALLARLVLHFEKEHHWKVYPDVVPVLTELRASGFPMVVVSNWDGSLPRLLDGLALAPFFDAYVISGIFGVSKPSPRIFEEAIRLLGLPASSVLHVGDSRDDDYHGARSTGLEALHLDRGATTDSPETISSLAAILDRVAVGRP